MDSNLILEGVTDLKKAKDVILQLSKELQNKGSEINQLSVKTEKLGKDLYKAECKIERLQQDVKDETDNYWEKQNELEALSENIEVDKEKLFEANRQIKKLEKELKDEADSSWIERIELETEIDEYKRFCFLPENIKDTLTMERLKEVIDLGRIDLLDGFLDTLPSDLKTHKEKKYRDSVYLEVEYLENEIFDLRAENKELEKRTDLEPQNIREKALIEVFTEKLKEGNYDKLDFALSVF